MKKITSKALLLVALVSSTLSANQTNDLNIIKKYEKEGFHSKKDIQEYSKLFNKNISKKTKNKKLDEITILKKMEFKGNTFEIYKEIDNKEAAKKMISKTVDKKISDDKKIKKYIYYIGKNLINWDAASLCSKLDKMNFFKYGGKFKETLEDKINNKTYNIIITNSKECKETKNKFEKTIKEFLKFMKNDVKNNN